MENPLGSKILEVKVRDLPNKPGSQDKKGAARVCLSNDALLDLGLAPGQLCYIWKAGDPENKREAIVWNTKETKMSKNVIQMTPIFREACGSKLVDTMCISATGDRVKVEDIPVQSVVLRDISSTTAEPVPELEPCDRAHWEWFLAERLERIKDIYPGLAFENVVLRGPKRKFVVESVNGHSTSIATFNEGSKDVVKIATHAELDSQSQSDSSAPKLAAIDVAGIDQALKKLNRFLSSFDKQFKETCGPRSCAALLHGGHGTGKTFIMDKIAATGWGKVHKIKSGTKPDAIRSTFQQARLSQPSIIIIDNLESMVSKGDAISENITEALEEELDKLADGAGNHLPRVLVIAATLDASSIPLSLKRAKRFLKQIPLPIPDATARKQILKSLSPPFPPDLKSFILDDLGDRTHAYTADDLVSLMVAVREAAEDRQEAEGEAEDGEKFWSQADIEEAIHLVRPTAMHDINLKPPSVRWNEIGGQDSVKKALRRAVETPLLHPERMKRIIGASATKGLLLYGPPGCSKTLSAQAMATEVGFNFFAVKGAELLNMYVGESERAVRDIFAKARAASPSIIFFDEIEAIGSKRETGGRSNGVNVLTTLLNEMDGIETLKGVMVLAATNQPQALDLALLRPGRFDKLLYVSPPDLAGREEILRVKKRTMDFADDVDIEKLAALTEGYSGAELVSICNTAAEETLEKCELLNQELQIQMEDFEHAIKCVKKQITPELIEGYERWAEGMRGDN